MSVKISAKVALFLLFVTLAQCGQRIDIVISGRDIPSHDLIWGETEPYVKVYYKFDASQNYISYGQTSTSKSNPNPDWPQVFSYDYTGGMNQMASFDMYDDDVMFDDFIGKVELPLGQIVQDAMANSGICERNLNPSKYGRLLLKVRIDGVIPSEQKVIKDPLVALLKKNNQ